MKVKSVSKINQGGSTCRIRFPYSILLINFIGTLGFSIVLPFLVFLVTDLE